MKLYQWHQIPVEQLGGGITRQLIKVEKMMLSKIFVPKDVTFPSHKLSSEQMTVFVKGAALYETDGEKIKASEGDIVYIPAGTEHTDKVTEDTIVLDIFSPPRHDWLK